MPNNNDLTSIDPALGLMKEFAKVTHGVPAHIQRMRQETIFKEGVVPTKYKVLASVLWAINTKCEPCIRFYIRQAIKSGVSEEELGEFLAVGATMGGCVGEMWSLKAYKAYKDTAAGAVQNESCCQVENHS
ncbi:carboxymuconolactone decarboxylase family protein [Candidatus Uhrbacteria bacterium]|nr:carboxymuconolactone decarboxylase family protein [Candidatus Uhrbacteria bacterium]